MANRIYSALIKTSTLRSLMDSKVPITIVDASYNIPGSTGNPKEEHFLKRIPGAKFFEVDEIADKSTKYPHMMPTDDMFRMFMKKLRIKNDNDLLVCYDRLGMISSPRVWYTFKVFGKKNVAVLDGGLPKWLAEGHPIESGKYDMYQDEKSENDQDYKFSLDKSMILSLDDVKKVSKELVENKTGSNWQILDARSAGRFQGTAPEPRPGLRSGSIPGSINTFFMSLYNEDKTFKSPEELRKIFESAGVNFDENINVINSCGSGMTACINILALKAIGKSNTSLYDGSWMEWGEVIKP